MALQTPYAATTHVGIPQPQLINLPKLHASHPKLKLGIRGFGTIGLSAILGVSIGVSLVLSGVFAPLGAGILGVTIVALAISVVTGLVGSALEYWRLKSLQTATPIKPVANISVSHPVSTAIRPSTNVPGNSQKPPQTAPPMRRTENYYSNALPTQGVYQPPIPTLVHLNWTDKKTNRPNNSSEDLPTLSTYSK